MLCQGEYTPLYEKGIKQNQNKPMETTHMTVFSNSILKQSSGHSLNRLKPILFLLYPSYILIWIKIFWNNLIRYFFQKLAHFAYLKRNLNLYVKIGWLKKVILLILLENLQIEMSLFLVENNRKILCLFRSLEMVFAPIFWRTYFNRDYNWVIAYSVQFSSIGYYCCIFRRRLLTLTEHFESLVRSSTTEIVVLI